MRNGAAKIKRMVLCCKYDIAKGAKFGDQEKRICRNGKMALSELYSRLSFNQNEYTIH